MLAIVAALGLVMGAVALVAGAIRQPNAAGDAAKLEKLSAARDYYYNMASPQVGPETSADVKVSADGGSSRAGTGGGSGDKSLGWKVDAKKGSNGWTAQTGTFAGTVGQGFIQHGGTFNFNQYYLAEWRNNDGFDKGLESAYDTAFFRPDTGEWTVTRTPYNAPGLLVWYRDIQYGNVNHVTIPRFNPSIGSEGGLLIVDSHYEPERRTIADGTTLRNMPSRAQSANAAFNLFGSYPFDECIETAPYVTGCTNIPARPAVSTFTDRFGWYPGLEPRPTGLFFRDVDASVVLPSRDNRRYTTRVVNPDGTPATGLYGLNVSGSRLGTGNPADGHAPEHTDDVSLGVSFKVVRVAKDNTYATVHVTPTTP